MFAFDKFRIEHTIGKSSPGSSDDRAKATVLARMGRVENNIQELGQTMDNVVTLLKTIDDKIEKLFFNQRSRTPSLPHTNNHDVSV